LAGALALTAALAPCAAPAWGADRQGGWGGTATGWRTAGRGDPFLRLFVSLAVEDVLRAGGTTADVLDAITEATTWYQGVQANLPQGNWLFRFVARVAAEDVILTGGTPQDLFNALDEVLSWWQTLPDAQSMTDDWLFQVAVHMTLPNVLKDGGTVQDVLDALDQIVTWWESQPGGTTGSNGGGTTGGTTGGSAGGNSGASGGTTNGGGVTGTARVIATQTVTPQAMRSSGRTGGK
jgi:hypothetical protein